MEEEYSTAKFHVTSRIKRDGKFYLVSTVNLIYTFSQENYETMVFSCDEHGEVKHHRELYCDRYTTEEEAHRGHDRACMMFEPPSEEEEVCDD